MFGGSARGSNSARETWIFDPESRAWRSGAPLHHRHNFVGSAEIGGKIFAVGEAIERYDRTTGTWEVVHSGDRLPRSHAFATGLAGEIYVLGGFPKERGHLQIFDVASRSLRDGPPFPDFNPGDHFILLATLAGGVHAVGGLDHETSEPERRHWRLEGGQWTERAPHPSGVMGKFTSWCVHRDCLFVFEREGHVYDPRTDRWTQLGDPPPMRVLPVTIGVGDEIVMLGGLEPAERKNEAWVYKIDEDEWELLASPQPE